MLMLPSSKMEKIRSSSLRSPPSSGAARHLLPQAGEGLPHPAGGRRAGSRWLAVLRLEIEDQVALEHRLETRVRKRLGLQHRRFDGAAAQFRSEEHTSELQSLMRISY